MLKTLSHETAPSSKDERVAAPNDASAAALPRSTRATTMTSTRKSLLAQPQQHPSLKPTQAAPVEVAAVAATTSWAIAAAPAIATHPSNKWPVKEKLFLVACVLMNGDSNWSYVCDQLNKWIKSTSSSALLPLGHTTMRTVLVYLDTIIV